MEEKCLIEETSFDYSNKATIDGKDTDQMPKSSCIKTKKALKNLAQAMEKTRAANILVNTDLKKFFVHSDWIVVLKKIPIGILTETVHAVLSEFGIIVLIKMQLVGLWQKTVVKFEQIDQVNLVVSGWFILIRKDAV
ncbi:hypothetical protein G9A89_023228 [Geosiphon pyriformis]|nr:hypothetical protein G9A89_023228 [Geosiphon pyriformis]